MTSMTPFRTALAVAVLGAVMAGCSDSNRSDLSENSTVETQNSDVATVQPNQNAALDRQAVTDAPLGTQQPGAASADAALAEDAVAQDPAVTEAGLNYETLSFTGESASLNDEAARTLDDITQSLDSDKPVAVTVRTMSTEATTEGAEEDALTQQRIDSVKQYLEDKGLEITQWKVDDAAATSDMTAPDEQDAQQLFITIISEPVTDGLSSL